MKVTDLRDIIRIIDQYGKPAIETLPNMLKGNKKNLIAKFHAQVLDKGVLDDGDVCNRIYGTRKLDTRYAFLKSQYSRLLMNSLLDLDLNKGRVSNQTIAIYNCYRSLFIVETLLRLGVRRHGIKLASKVLTFAEKYNFTLISVELYNLLRNHEVLLGNTRMYRKYSQLHQEKLELLVNESACHNLDYEVRHRFASSSYIDSSTVAIARASYSKISDILERSESYSIRMIFYRIRFIYEQITGDQVSAYSTAQSAIEYLSRTPHLSPPSRTGEFALYQLETSLLLRSSERASIPIQLCLKTISQGSNLWFLFMEYRFLHCLHNEKYELASQLYYDTTTHTRFNIQLRNIKEKWEVYQSYIDYLERTGVVSIDSQSKDKKVSLLRYRKYRELVRKYPTYNKDKRGVNVSIIILNLLILLESKMYSGFIQQLEALKTYRQRYLRSSHSRQSAALFRLLQIVVKEDFEIKRVRMKGKDLIALLQDTELSPSDFSESLQVMPFQWVWERIEFLLARDKSKR
jgi:hypothetical protein